MTPFSGQPDDTVLQQAVTVRERLDGPGAISTKCQCEECACGPIKELGRRPCQREITQEDMLCNTCRYEISRKEWESCHQHWNYLVT